MIEQQHIALQMSKKSYDKLLSQKASNDKEIIKYKSKIKMLNLKIKDIVAMKGHGDYDVNYTNRFDVEIDHLYRNNARYKKRKLEHNYAEFETRIDNPITQNPLQRSNSAPLPKKKDTPKKHVTVVQEDPQLQHNKDLQRQKIKWANPFRNKTNQSTKSFRNTVFNNKNNAAQSSGKFIKRGFNGLGGTHKVHMTKKKSLITNHMLMKKKKQQQKSNGESRNPFLVRR